MLRPWRIFLGAIALALVLPGLAMASVTTSGKPTRPNRYSGLCENRVRRSSVAMSAAP